MRIGILAMQGAVEPHRAKLAGAGVEVIHVRAVEDLRGCDGLIIPGGESTTVLKLIRDYRLREPILGFALRKPLWGVCAGSILMAREVENPKQESLGLVPICIRRNAYGRQNESFITRLELCLPAEQPTVQEGVFIRAPQVVKWDEEVMLLAVHAERPVALQYRHHLITTFHPELSESMTLHRHFLNLCSAARHLHHSRFESEPC